ncbi:MAG: T9SS C-terminal target domain-containing protein [Chitinophagaceae bacterium]|nr:MAG: T9SS C-terminal target domain-containing protein [Chitinophagaceae bacterium]
MKNYIIILLCGLIHFSSLAVSPETQTVLSEHLKEINAEWTQKGFEDKYNKEITFKNDIERIQKHLELVEHHLRETNHSYSDAGLQKRNELLDVLNEYRKDGIFPINTFHNERIPYFIDIYGTACAVGYLMIESGYKTLAEKIQEEGNYRYIREIDYPEVGEWAENHGFTLSELAWIQPSYGPYTIPLPLGEGVDEEVKKMAITYHNPIQLYIAGSFNQAGDIPCQTFAVWNGVEYECPIQNLEGEVNDINSMYNRIILSGKFIYDNETHNFIERSNSEWSFHNVLPELNATLTGFVASQPFDYVSGYYTDSENSMNHFIAKRKINPQGSWEIIAEMNGKVNSIESVQGQGIYFAGEFTEVNEEEMNYVGHYQYISFGIDSGTLQAVGDGLDSPVRVLKNLNGIFHAAGTIIDEFGERKFGLARFHNNQWQQLIGESNFWIESPDADLPMYINDIVFRENQIFLAGKFSFFMNVMEEPGVNLGVLSPLSGIVQGYGTLNDEVNSIVFHTGNSEFLVGGKFTSSSLVEFEGQVELNHLAQLSRTTGISSIETSNFKVFPNPATDRITIELDRTYQDIRLTAFAMDGRAVETDFSVISNQIFVNRAHLPDGLYMLKVFSGNNLLGSGRVVFSGE